MIVHTYTCKRYSGTRFKIGSDFLLRMKIILQCRCSFRGCSSSERFVISAHLCDVFAPPQLRLSGTYLIHLVTRQLQSLFKARKMSEIISEISSPEELSPSPTKTFLDLPREIRDQIYAKALVASTSIDVWLGYEQSYFPGDPKKIPYSTLAVWLDDGNKAIDEYGPLCSC
jgi:hypothetical protein